MILRSGLASTHLVMFPSGAPDGDVTWTLLAPDGTELDSGAITPANGAVSVNIPLSAAALTLGNGVWQQALDVLWTYEVSGAVVNGEYRYTVESRLPLGVSASGVRQKLGVSPSDLPDDQISLVGGYLEFVDEVGQAEFDAATGVTAVTDLRVRNGIEALSALSLLPTMAVRVASSESSGTNEFKRQNIKWEEMAGVLYSQVTAAYTAIDPTYSPIEDIEGLFVLATPASDAFTG